MNQFQGLDVLDYLSQSQIATIPGTKDLVMLVLRLPTSTFVACSAKYKCSDVPRHFWNIYSHDVLSAWSFALRYHNYITIFLFLQ